MVPSRKVLLKQPGLFQGALLQNGGWETDNTGHPDTSDSAPYVPASPMDVDLSQVQSPALVAGERGSLQIIKWQLSDRWPGGDEPYNTSLFLSLC